MVVKPLGAPGTDSGFPPPQADNHNAQQTGVIPINECLVMNIGVILLGFP